MAIPLPATPILPVADMDAASGFYRAAGFTVEAYDDGYSFVLHDGREVLHLAAIEDMDVPANRAACYLHRRDVDAIHGSWRAAGMAVTPVGIKAWGMREFSVTDPSGNLVRVGSNL